MVLSFILIQNRQYVLRTNSVPMDAPSGVQQAYVPPQREDAVGQVVRAVQRKFRRDRSLRGKDD